jgi:hypothetical protein
VEIGGISASANGLWMSQIARNLTDSVDGLLTGKRYLIHDRDPLFTDEFLRTLPFKHACDWKFGPYGVTKGQCSTTWLFNEKGVSTEIVGMQLRFQGRTRNYGRPLSNGRDFGKIPWP